MKTASEVTLSLAKGTCWVEEIGRKCPFLVPAAAGRGPACAFFGVFLQDFLRDGKTYVARCDECKKWRGHLTVTLMPA